MGFPNLVWVFLGGGIGSVGRYALSWLLMYLLPAFPLGTLTVNLFGSLAAGWLLGRFPDTGYPVWKLFWLTGLLGGFTTFSAFSLETFNLWLNSQRSLALLNFGLNLIGGLLAVSLGFWLARH